MRVVFTVTAEADFESIGDFIADDNPLRAVSFVRELRQACVGLADSPGRFPLAENLEATGIRRRSYRRYGIFYRVNEDRVVILRIVHGSRELDDEDFISCGDELNGT